MRILLVFENLQVDIHDSAEQTHVCTLIEAHGVLPHVDDENLGRGQGEQRSFALKFLHVNTEVSNPLLPGPRPFPGHRSLQHP